MPEGTYVIRLFESWNRVEHPLTQALCLSMAIFLIKLLCQCSDFINSPCDADPLYLLKFWIAFSVYAEVSVVLAFNQPVPSPISIATPRLHGERDVRVSPIFGCPGLVCIVDHCFDMLVLVQTPETECVEEDDLLDRVSQGASNGELSTYALYSSHRIEVATATEWICCPFLGPLRLLSLDCFFESSAVVTLSANSGNVSLVITSYAAI